MGAGIPNTLRSLAGRAHPVLSNTRDVGMQVTNQQSPELRELLSQALRD